MVGDVVARRAADRPVAAGAASARVDAGDALQPAWGRFLERSPRYGLPALPRVRHLRTRGPAGDAGHRLSELTDDSERAMSMKSWVLDRVHGMQRPAGRSDLPPRDAAREPDLDARRRRARAAAGAPDALRAGAEHLGAYAPLIAAIRDELEHFVASHVRLHLAIAERDRFC